MAAFNLFFEKAGLIFNVIHFFHRKFAFYDITPLKMSLVRLSDSFAFPVATKRAEVCHVEPCAGGLPRRSTNDRPFFITLVREKEKENRRSDPLSNRKLF